MLERIVCAGGSFASFGNAAKLFELLTDLVISKRTINNKTILIGGELKEARDTITDAHIARPITAPAKVAEPAVSLAVAQVDGGRMQTRTTGRGSGVHDDVERPSSTPRYDDVKSYLTKLQCLWSHFIEFRFHPCWTFRSSPDHDMVILTKAASTAKI